MSLYRRIQTIPFERKEPIDILDLSIEKYESEDKISFYTRPLWIKSIVDGYFIIDMHKRINPDMRKTIQKLRDFGYFRGDELRFPIVTWGYYTDNTLISNIDKIIELFENGKPLLAKFVIRKYLEKELDVLSYKLSWDEFDINPNEAFDNIGIYNPIGLPGTDIGPIKINKCLQNPSFNSSKFWVNSELSEERIEWYKWRRNYIKSLRDELSAYFTLSSAKDIFRVVL